MPMLTPEEEEVLYNERQMKLLNAENEKLKAFRDPFGFSEEDIIHEEDGEGFIQNDEGKDNDDDNDDDNQMKERKSLLNYASAFSTSSITSPTPTTSTSVRRRSDDSSSPIPSSPLSSSPSLNYKKENVRNKSSPPSRSRSSSPQPTGGNIRRNSPTGSIGGSIGGSPSSPGSIDSLSNSVEPTYRNASQRLITYISGIGGGSMDSNTSKSLLVPSTVPAKKIWKRDSSFLNGPKNKKLILLDDEFGGGGCFKTHILTYIYFIFFPFAVLFFHHHIF